MQIETTQEFAIPGVEQMVRITIISSRKEFKWKMEVEDPANFGSPKSFLSSGWTSQYEGILTIQLGEQSIAYATDYWMGNLPVEVPFVITPGKPVFHAIPI